MWCFLLYGDCFCFTFLFSATACVCLLLLVIGMGYIFQYKKRPFFFFFIITSLYSLCMIIQFHRKISRHVTNPSIEIPGYVHRQLAQLASDKTRPAFYQKPRRRHLSATFLHSNLSGSPLQPLLPTLYPGY